MNKYEEFDKLVIMAYEMHNFTYCIKKRDAIFTYELKGKECLNCKEFILNKGICDPL